MVGGGAVKLGVMTFCFFVLFWLFALMVLLLAHLSD